MLAFIATGFSIGCLIVSHLQMRKAKRWYKAAFDLHAAVFAEVVIKGQEPPLNVLDLMSRREPRGESSDDDAGSA